MIVDTRRGATPLAHRNQKGDEGTPGTARVVLPRKNGPAVPYPFDPGVLGEAKI